MQDDLKTRLIPARDEGSKRLLVVLHGLGDSMEGYSWMPQALNLPHLNYLFVNAPDRYYGGYSWYDFAGEARPGVLRSREALRQLLDKLPGDGFPAAETGLFGFSQGCLMAFEAGLRYPHRLWGLAGISGYVFEPEELLRELSPAAREQRLLWTHGTRDPLIPLDLVESQAELLKAAGLQIQWHVFNKEHAIAGAEEIEVIRKFFGPG